MAELHELLEEVEDKASFLRFVHALIADRIDEAEKEKKKPGSSYGAGANGWENGTIESYLEASVACAEDHGNKNLLTEKASYKSFANFLYAGKIYE